MASNKTLACAIALALGATSGAARAGQLDYTVYAGVEHSDNINLSTHDPVSQNVLVPGMSFDYSQQGSTLQATAVGNVEYRNYLGNAYDDQFFGELASQLNWSISPQRLDFVVQDYASVQPLSTLSSDAPDNQQETNVFAVGPNLRFNLGQSLRGQAELRYIGSHASKTDDFNSSRGQAALRVIRDLSPTSLISLNAEHQQIDFYDIDNGRYNRTQAYGRYARNMAHFTVDVALGWSQLAPRGGDKVSSPLERVDLSWVPTTRQTFGISAAREYSDSAQDMISLSEQAIGNTPLPYSTPTGIQTGGAVIASQPYLERRAQAYYAFSGERLSLSISPRYRRLEYPIGNEFDQTGRGIDAGINYRLREHLTLSGFANEERLTYRTLDRRDTTRNYGVSLTGTATPHWSWRASWTDRQRLSTDPEGKYRAKEIYFGVVYQR